MHPSLLAVVFSVLLAPILAVAGGANGEACKAYKDCSSNYCAYTNKANQPTKGTCQPVVTKATGKSCNSSADCESTLCEANQCVCKTSMMPCGTSNQCCSGKNKQVGKCWKSDPDGFVCQIPQ